MDVQQFEQAILKLAFETDARISTASVAYYLGIPSKKANELLNALLEEGVLELDSDRDGNLYYQVPNQPESTEGLMPRLRLEQQNRVDAQVAREQADNDQISEQSRRSTSLSNSVMMVSANDDDDVEPISPRASSGRGQGYQHRQDSPDDSTTDLVTMAGRRARIEPHDEVDGRSGGRAETPGWQPPSRSPSPFEANRSEADRSDANGRSSQRDGLRRGGSDGWNEPRKPRVRTRVRNKEDLFAGLTQRQAQPDASLDRCGASSVIVSDAVRCEPKPLPTRKPVVASCVESDMRSNQWASRSESSHSGQLFERAQSQSTMLAPTASGELAMRDDQMERPEHQPGMALLLSLILCGTGQIYNGEVSKGIMMMVLCFLLWFVLLGWVVHIWSIVDSVVVAERLNRKAG
jgi:hypothetical protein